MPAAVAATPPKPRTPAAKAMTRNTNAQYSALDRPRSYAGMNPPQTPLAAHSSTHNPQMGGVSPSVYRRRAPRARESRERTVPMGMPRIRPTSP